MNMIETERLILRLTIQGDLRLYRALFQDPHIVKYLPGGEPYSSDYIANYVAEKLAHWEKGFGTFTVALKEQPHVEIGYAGVEQLSNSPHHDVRYGLLPEYQGTGYAFEAAKAAIDFVLANYLDEVFGVAVKANAPSLKILKKMGMELSSKSLYDSNDLVTLSLKRPL
jgi:ribosomal-protein-alanine N-acetyltransferase